MQLYAHSQFAQYNAGEAAWLRLRPLIYRGKPSFDAPHLAARARVRFFLEQRAWENASDVSAKRLDAQFSYESVYGFFAELVAAALTHVPEVRPLRSFRLSYC